jgi:hypothetical protein
MNPVTREETRGRTRSARRSRRAVQAAVVVFLIGAGAVTSLAHIIMVGGDAVLLTPDDVRQDQNESDTDMLAFDEKQCITLKDDLETDQGTIPAGTSVSCHMMRVDPANGGVVLQGTAIFDAPIIGVISDSELLDESDDPCGLDDTTYPDPGDEEFRGLEDFQPNDQYRPVQQGCGLQLRSDVPSFQDEVRVITECCEEENCCGD